MIYIIVFTLLAQDKQPLFDVWNRSFTSKKICEQTRDFLMQGSQQIKAGFCIKIALPRKNEE